MSPNNKNPLVILIRGQYRSSSMGVEQLLWGLINFLGFTSPINTLHKGFIMTDFHIIIVQIYD